MAAPQASRFPTRSAKKQISPMPCGWPISRRRACSTWRLTAPGTPVGDPIEAAAIGAIYGKARKAEDRCVIGSIKSNVGHLEAAAGISGVDQDGTVSAASPDSGQPALRKSEPANRRSTICGCALRSGWSPGRETYGHPPRAGVNSFGFGGTNGHAILEAAPDEAIARAWRRARRRPRLDAAAFGAQRSRAARSGTVLSERSCVKERA